jgi:hypothetical protein
MRWLLLLCISNAPVAAQRDSTRDEAKALLFEVRKKVMQTVNRLPKYMCTETIDRSTFLPQANLVNRSCDDLASRRKKADWTVRKYKSDRLRLDVATVSDTEMYSWAGENRFEDRELADLVRGGATSTGAFAAFLSSIFGTDAAGFTYNGDVTADGRALVEFGFRVPAQKSSHRIGNKLHSTVVPYDGTFLVDPKTLDLVRLTVVAGQLPEDLNACEEITTLDYRNVRLNDSEFLLPKDARLQIVEADGSELDNRAVFSGCHEFHSESSINFGTASETEPAAAGSTGYKALILPPGLSFKIALTRAIAPATAAAGDPLKAKLTGPIKEKTGGILVPAGAAVTGRILQIERLYRPKSESLTVAYKLETIEANGVAQPFDASMKGIAKRRSKSTSSFVVRLGLGAFDQLFDSDDQSVGFLEFKDVKLGYVINPTMAMEGVTSAPK